MKFGTCCEVSLQSQFSSTRLPSIYELLVLHRLCISKRFERAEDSFDRDDSIVTS
jgi:hypothetical protein